MKLALLALGLTAAAFVSCTSDADSGATERLAPTFNAEEVRPGRPSVTLALVEGKPAVVNFFAAWCEPCEKELPLLVAAERRLRGEVAFLGVDVKDSRTRATEMLEKYDITYPAVYDPQGDVAAAFRVRGMPNTFFVRPDGRIADQVFGEMDAKRLAQALRRLGVEQ